MYFHPKSAKRSVRIRTDNNTIINLPSSPAEPSLSPTKSSAALPPNPSDKSSSTQQEDLCESSFVKSVSFFGDLPNDPTEIFHKRKPKVKVAQRPMSSKPALATIPPPPPFLVTNGSPRKDPAAQSNSSLGTVSSAQPQKLSRLSAHSGPHSILRESAPSKLSLSRQRVKLNTSTTTISPLAQHATGKTRFVQ